MPGRRKPKDIWYVTEPRLRKLFTAKGKRRTHRLERREGRREVERQRDDG